MENKVRTRYWLFSTTHATQFHHFIIFENINYEKLQQKIICEIVIKKYNKAYNIKKYKKIQKSTKNIK